MTQPQAPESITWGTDAWFEESIRSSAKHLPVTPGASAIIQHVVTDTPMGEIRFVDEKRDGRTVGYRWGDDPSADVVVTMSYADYRRVFEEERTSDQNPKVTTTGRSEVIERLVPVRRTPAFRAHIRHMAAVTRWP